MISLFLIRLYRTDLYENEKKIKLKRAVTRKAASCHGLGYMAMLFLLYGIYSSASVN